MNANAGFYALDIADWAGGRGKDHEGDAHPAISLLGLRLLRVCGVGLTRRFGGRNAVGKGGMGTAVRDGGTVLFFLCCVGGRVGGIG